MFIYSSNRKLTNNINNSNKFQNRINQKLQIKNSSIRISADPISNESDGYSTPDINNGLGEFVKLRFDVDNINILSGYVDNAFIATDVDGNFRYKELKVKQHGESIDKFSTLYNYHFIGDQNDDVIHFFLIFIDKNGNVVTKLVYLVPEYIGSMKEEIEDNKTGEIVKTVYGAPHHIFKKSTVPHVVDVSSALDDDYFNKGINNSINKASTIKIKTKLNSNSTLEENKKIIDYLKENYIINQ